jgi:penicillin-binding protein A
MRRENNMILMKQKISPRKARRTRARSVFGLALLAVAVVLLVQTAVPRLSALVSPAAEQTGVSDALLSEESRNLTPGQLAGLFDYGFLERPDTGGRFDALLNDLPVTVTTTIDSELQDRLGRLFKNSDPYCAAAVVLDARSGAVLAMTHYDGVRREPAAAGEPVFINATFPAASLIKIITAAAVVEKKGFASTDTLPVAGRHHTLYKHQLGLARPRFKAAPMTLERAFALSVNPFFGKLGISHLTDAEFTTVAGALLFDTDIDFDLPLPQSSVFEPETDFERAERASGYNSRTMITPLHAALLAAMVVDDGRIMRPHLVREVGTEDGDVRYQRTPGVYAAPLSAQSAQELRRMMSATVRNGTAHKSFSQLRRMRGYGDWSIGGKTGAITIPGINRRCEWYAGFAQNGDTEIAMAVVVVHRELWTIKPAGVAAEIIRESMRRTPSPTRLSCSPADASAG